MVVGKAGAGLVGWTKHKTTILSTGCFEGCLTISHHNLSIKSREDTLSRLANPQPQKQQFKNYIFRLQLQCSTASRTLLFQSFHKLQNKHKGSNLHTLILLLTTKFSCQTVQVPPVDETMPRKLQIKKKERPWNYMRNSSSLKKHIAWLLLLTQAALIRKNPTLFTKMVIRILSQTIHPYTWIREGGKTNKNNIRNNYNNHNRSLDSKHP